jgi:8-oxo-dGTP pyrophosphatase MutT (NUDIX family)
MNERVSERVGAFIVRRNMSSNLYELLLFRHVDYQNVSVQIPGGGVDAGETLEEALHREIYEESGLLNLPIVRKLGALDRCWLDTKNTARRHYYLLEAPSSTRDRWEHIVHGAGADKGLRFAYFWYRPTQDFTLTGGSASFLNPFHLPELFNQE